MTRAYLNSYHQSGLKNLLDVAVLEYAGLTERIKAGVQYRKIDEIPFDFQRRRMSVVVEGKGRHLLICKGAVEEVFSCCTHAEVNGCVEALEPSYLGQLLQVTRELNEDGFRVIAIAYKETASRGGRLRIEGRERSGAGGLHRLPGSAQGQRTGGHRSAPSAWRASQDPDRGQ